MEKESTTQTVQPIIYSRSEHSVSRKNIDADALKILRRLIRNGHKAYLVGGSVRDLLLERQPKDFDIATDATPRQMKALFRNCRIIGRRFKLAHIYFGGGKIIEVSTFRDKTDFVEGEGNGDPDDLLITRDNTYGTEVTDALRRDLTINALFYDLSTFSIVDYVGGMQDIQAGVARVIGDPAIRFAEDPVRMLRVIRYAVKAGFRLDPATEKALRASHTLLAKSSTARIFEDFKKDLCSGYAAPILKSYAEYNLLEQFLPELAAGSSALVSERSALYQALSVVDEVAQSQKNGIFTAALSLLALFSNSGTMAEPNLTARFDNASMLKRFFDYTFTKLLVPRKEREKITAILLFWLELERTPLEKVRRQRLAHSSVFGDLVLLLTFLNYGGAKADILAFLNAADVGEDRRQRSAPRRQDRRRRWSRRR